MKKILLIIGIVVAVGLALAFGFSDEEQGLQEKMSDVTKSVVASVQDLAPHKDITLTPHKALYDIRLTATRSGAQVVNVSGTMYYEMMSTCDSWLTDHRFNLRYEYVDAPAVEIKSHFSTYETMDGSSLNYTATRRRNGDIYEKIDGIANMGENGGQAVFKNPDGVEFELVPGLRFPMKHTVSLLEKAIKNERFFHSVIFDGSDAEGPVAINAFIGNKLSVPENIGDNEKIDTSLLEAQAYKMRLAFFPEKEDSSQADYEMEMRVHENGIVSDMAVDYDTFSVAQELVALEQLPLPECAPN